MTTYKIPHLCGGTLFDLLLESMKPRRKARNKLDGGTDGLTLPGIFAGLIYVVTGEDASSFTGETLRKCASNFKKCESGGGVYVPFTDPATISAFNSEVQRKNPDLLNRMSGFIDTYLNISKCEWLARALIETMQKDEAVSDTTMIAVDYEHKVPVKELHTVRKLILQPFLISILNYVLQNSPDAESGKDTFLAWYSQASTRAEWKFREDNTVGDSIDPIEITCALPDITGNSGSEASCSTEENTVTSTVEQSDDDVIAESLGSALRIFAEALEANKHQMAEQIRANKKKHDSQETNDSSSETQDSSGTTIIQHQTNVIQHGQKNVNMTNNGTINIKF